MNTALKAKKDYIERTFDYSTNVTNIPVEMFSQIINSNKQVNETVDEFVGKL